MAKKYADYEALVKMANDTPDIDAWGRQHYQGWVKTEFAGRQNGFKPGSTMGYHHILVTETPDGVLVEGYDTGGNLTGTAFITPKHTLGYNAGEVWRVLKPEFVKDPLQKVLRQYRLGKDRIHWVNADYVHELDMDYISRGEGYVTFTNGESVHARATFGFVTLREQKVGPIDQRYYLGDIYVLKNTPRNEVAAFIEGVWKGTWTSNPADECKLSRKPGLSRSIKIPEYEITVHNGD
jgi:hypothetical protein